MPYNKGDFTQQGINGDVSALVRLNEKRVMKVVLSSDDESDNCDISGKVYDLLNGTSYDIGSGGGGGGDLTTAQVTITNNKNVEIASTELASVYPDDNYYLTGWAVEANSSTDFTFVLYKGKVGLGDIFDANHTLLTGDDITSTTGSVENLSDEYELYLVISGDGTITFG